MPPQTAPKAPGIVVYTGGPAAAVLDVDDAAAQARAGTEDGDGELCGVRLVLWHGPGPSVEPRQPAVLAAVRVVVVERMVPGGAAAASGLVRSGDVLIAVREADTERVGLNTDACTHSFSPPSSTPLPELSCCWAVSPCGSAVLAVPFVFRHPPSLHLSIPPSLHPSLSSSLPQGFAMLADVHCGGDNGGG